MIEYWIWGGVFVTTALLLIVLGRMAYARNTDLAQFEQEPDKKRILASIILR